VLAKHVADASWGQLTAMLDYKAANATIELLRVDPRGTSQTFPECGIVECEAKTLAERRHRCQCGADIDRDVAAAMVVHFVAFGFWPGAGLGSLSEPVAA
jgi:putative transposase